MCKPNPLAFWSISNSIYTYLAALQVAEIGVHQLSKTVVLRTANILRRHISLPSSSGTRELIYMHFCN